jgi:hypothetical protein
MENDLDFMATPQTSGKDKFIKPENPITEINGIKFYNGMRFWLDKMLFEIVNQNRITYVGGYDCPKPDLKNTVFDISGTNWFEFLNKYDLTGDVKKYIIGKNYPDSTKIYEMINKQDLEWRND